MIRVHNSKTFVDIPLPLVGLFVAIAGLRWSLDTHHSGPTSLLKTHYRWLILGVWLNSVYWIRLQLFFSAHAALAKGT